MYLLIQFANIVLGIFALIYKEHQPLGFLFGLVFGIMSWEVYLFFLVTKVIY